MRAMELSVVEVVLAGVIGLIAGLLGGLAGIGGSMVMLPALHMVFGEPRESSHHLYMAAALAVNVAVAVPAAASHYRAGAVRSDLLRVLLPTVGITIVLGVLLSNRFGGTDLRKMLALFLLGYCIYNFMRLVRPRRETPGIEEPLYQVRPTALLGCGTAAGLTAGLLGLGGGVVLVPLLQMLGRVRLRNAIATSSAVICVTAVFGAGLKLATLGAVGESVRDALLLAVAMAPTGILGGWIGGMLTHRLPLTFVRTTVTVLLLVAAARLGGLW